MSSIRSFGQCTKCNDFLDKEEAGYGLCLKCSNIGTASELKVQSLFTQAGYAVAKVLSPMSPTDIVVSRHGEWLPLQVKTAYSGIVNLCKTTPTGRESYTDREARFFIVVDGEDLYIVPRAYSDRVMRPSLSSLQRYRVIPGVRLALYLQDDADPVAGGMVNATDFFYAENVLGVRLYAVNRVSGKVYGIATWNEAEGWNDLFYHKEHNPLVITLMAKAEGALVHLEGKPEKYQRISQDEFLRQYKRMKEEYNA